MANTVKMKQSAVAGKVPTTAQLALGELAINTVDGKLYLKKNVSGTETIVDVTAAAAGLTPATATTLGGVKDGAGVTIAADGTLSADVTSVAGRTGAVTLAVADVSGAAPAASPTFTGTPAAPTAAQGTNTTQLATTAFVQAEIAADAAPLSHVGATGAAHGAATTSVAGFMSSADKSKLDGISAGAQVNAVTSVAGRTGAVTLAVADVSGAQESLVSGTNIKSINGASILGSGNLVVEVVPAGSVIYFGASTAPTGWLKANGAAISRTIYSALFAAIGTTFGAGDGSTTFNIPDLRGEFIRGWDDGAGLDTGRTFASYQTDAMQGHIHRLANTEGSAAGSVGDTNIWAGTGNSGQVYNTGGPLTDGTNGTPRTAAETRPKNTALLPCIKY